MSREDSVKSPKEEVRKLDRRRSVVKEEEEEEVPKKRVSHSLTYGQTRGVDIGLCQTGNFNIDHITCTKLILTCIYLNNLFLRTNNSGIPYSH